MEGEGFEGDGLGGLGMGTGASIGDVANGGAMAATGETGVGGIGGDPSSGSGSAAAIADGSAISGNASFNGELADQNVGGFVGSGVGPGGTASQDVSGTDPAAIALMNEIQNSVAVTQSGALAVGPNMSGTGTGQLGPGNVQGIPGTNSSVGGATSLASGLAAIAAGHFGADPVGFSGPAANIASAAPAGGVPAETPGVQNAGIPGGFSGAVSDFSQFTEAAPGVSVSNSGAISAPALDAFADIATGPSAPASSGVQSVVADSPSSSHDVADNLADLATNSPNTAVPNTAAAPSTEDAPAGRGGGATVGQAAASGGGAAAEFGSENANFGGSATQDGAGANGFGDFGSGLNGGGIEARGNAYDVTQAASNNSAAGAILGAVFGSGLNQPWPQFSPYKNNPYWTFNF